MLHLYHGENTVGSRKELDTIRTKFADKEVIILEGRTISPTDLIQATETTTMFGSDRLVIVENLLSKRLGKKATDQKDFAEVMKRLPTDAEIVFWENKEISKTLLGLFPKTADIALFRPDRVVFTFADAIAPGKTKQLLSLFEQSIDKDAPELVFALLVRQLRNLIMAKELGKQVPELTPWQAAKFVRQAAYFTLYQLIYLYEQLLQIDVKIKSGNTAYTLTEELELFIVEL